MEFHENRSQFWNSEINANICFISFLDFHFIIVSFIVVVSIPLYTLLVFYICPPPPPPYNVFPLICVIFYIFQLFHVSNFIFSKVPIFFIFSYFLFPNFHTFNFSNSNSHRIFLLSCHSIPPLVPYFIPPHFTIFPLLTYSLCNVPSAVSYSLSNSSSSI